jgi:hypothetical protein
MNCKIAVVGIGGWYPRGVSRLIQSFDLHSPGFDISAWVNCLPPGAPADVVEDGTDFTGYCAKPFALRELMTQGADIGILMDAAFYAIAHIQPLVEHIASKGYYLCKNGYMVGQWASDRALERLGVTREYAFQIEEASSYCVGLNFSDSRAVNLLDQWCGYAGDRLTFPGPHTNTKAAETLGGGRNPGWCSEDSRVSGHRHDQSSLSVIAHRLGMNVLVERPRFTAYLGHENSETVLVNHGGL